MLSEFGGLYISLKAFIGVFAKIINTEVFMSKMVKDLQYVWHHNNDRDQQLINRSTKLTKNILDIDYNCWDIFGKQISPFYKIFTC
jgi:hypothetical protein